MSRFRKIMLALLILCVALTTGELHSLAADGEPYTYMVTFYAGDKGTFSGTGVWVENQSGPAPKINTGSSAITVTGLEPGDRVGLDAVSGRTVVPNDNNKYYVKGIRKSGYDNNTVAASSFVVTGDEDYVVAYGIKGDMVSYTVNFQDASGNTLAPSETYYGNVGDKPVIAFLYVEGYVPEAYNLTKTLVSDESQNVFTFVYTPIPSAAQPSESQGGTATGNAGTAAENGNQAADGTGNQEEPGTESAGQNLQEEPEEEAPRELVDLDDEETPLANVEASDNKSDRGSHVLRNVLIAVAIAALAGVGAYFFFKPKKRSKEKDAEEKKSE